MLTELDYWVASAIWFLFNVALIMGLCVLIAIFFCCLVELYQGGWDGIVKPLPTRNKPVKAD